MVLILNTMFQTCFQSASTTVVDPINSFSELVMEGLMDVEDGLASDEHGADEHDLKLSSALHWTCDQASTSLSGGRSWALHRQFPILNKVLLNFNGEVLLPPPDVRTA